MGKEKFVIIKQTKLAQSKIERLRYFVLLGSILAFSHLIAAKIKPYLHHNETFLSKKASFLVPFSSFFGFCSSSFFFKDFCKGY